MVRNHVDPLLRALLVRLYFRPPRWIFESGPGIFPQTQASAGFILSFMSKRGVVDV